MYSKNSIFGGSGIYKKSNLGMGRIVGFSGELKYFDVECFFERRAITSVLGMTPDWTTGDIATHPCSSVSLCKSIQALTKPSCIKSNLGNDNCKSPELISADPLQCLIAPPFLRCQNQAT